MADWDNRRTVNQFDFNRVSGSLPLPTSAQGGHMRVRTGRFTDRLSVLVRILHSNPKLSNCRFAADPVGRPLSLRDGDTSPCRGSLTYPMGVAKMIPATVTTIPQAYVDVRGACAYTCLSRRTLDQAKADGDLPYYKVGAKVLFSVADLDEWIALRRIDVRADIGRMRIW